MGRVENKVAVFTGAKLEAGAVGIGGAVARQLVTEGARVVLVNRTLETAQALADEINDGLASAAAIAVSADLTDAEQVAGALGAALAAFGTIDILVNNAAVTGTRGREKDVLQVSVETWDAIYAINVRAPFLMIAAALPAMLAQGSGSIVNVSSTASLSGDFIRTAYGSSKAALNVLSQYVATQYGHSGIRCNAILPGLTATGNTRANMPAETWTKIERHVSRPSANTAEDVARVVVFLASDDGAGINGEIPRVDGGFHGHAPYALDVRDLTTGRTET